jgi:hypothetical protein
MVDSGTYTPEAIARRMQIAQQLLDFSKEKPVHHWAQGLDELAKGAIGGAMFGQAEENERKSRYDSNNAMLQALGLPNQTPYVPQYQSPIDRVASLFGGGSAPAAAAPVEPPPAPPMGAPVPAAVSAPPPVSRPAPVTAGAIDDPNSDYNRSLLAPPAGRAGVVAALSRPEVMPTPKVWGDSEAEAAGLYEPRPGAQPSALAPAAPMPIPSGPPPPTASTGLLADMPMEKRRQIAALLSNPGTQAMGQTLLAKTLGESGNTDEIKEYNLSVQQDRAAGRAPPSFYDWKTGLKKAGAQNISIDQKGETEFSKAAGKHQAERFNELAADGPNAKQMLSDMNTLVELGKNIGTGKGAEVKAALGPYADALGIKVEGLSDIQAYEAIVNRVAPSLRVKGSGAQSDYELKNFVKSLPSLGNTPEGNAIMKSTLDGLYQNKVRAAEIGAKALSGEITRSEAEKQLQKLPDPMEGYREFQKQRKSPAAAPAAAGQPDRAAIEAEMKRREMKP